MANTHEGGKKIAAKLIGITIEEYRAHIDAGENWCNKGNHWQPASNFGRDNSRWNGLKARCFSCERAKERKNMKGRESPFKGKTHSLISRLKLSLAQRGNKKRAGKHFTPEQLTHLRQQTIANAARGEHNARWKGGITPKNKAIRATPEYIDWRNAVFARDNFTCQHCGDNRGGNLNAHHIKEFSKHPELRFDVSNGLTLCNSCHAKLHRKH